MLQGINTAMKKLPQQQHSQQQPSQVQPQVSQQQQAPQATAAQNVVNGNGSSKTSARDDKQGNEEGQHKNTSGDAAGPSVLKHVDNYIVFSEKLGGGQFSQVYKAMDKNDKTHTKYFAVKVIPMSSVQYQKFSNYNQLLQKEIEILLKARHQNLICMHDLKQTPNNLYLFLDYCNGGDLRAHLVKKNNRLAEEEGVELFKQMCAGYRALNEKMVIHRDLKPENIMLHEGKVKIGDFGFARIVSNLDQAVRMTQKCSPLYAPPQILMNEEYSSKCDVWSMGCILFEMLFGRPPFIAHSIFSLVDNIKKHVGSGPYSLPSFPPIADQTKSLLIGMLRFHEKDRVSWDEVFKHPVNNPEAPVSSLTNKRVVDNLVDSAGDSASNPLEQSIRKNFDAVWEKKHEDAAAQEFKEIKIQEFVPIEPVLPVPIAIQGVPSSNKLLATLFQPITRQKEQQQEVQPISTPVAADVAPVVTAPEVIAVAAIAATAPPPQPAGQIENVNEKKEIVERNEGVKKSSGRGELEKAVEGVKSQVGLNKLNEESSRIKNSSTFQQQSQQEKIDRNLSEVSQNKESVMNVPTAAAAAGEGLLKLRKEESNEKKPTEESSFQIEKSTEKSITKVQSINVTTTIVSERFQEISTGNKSNEVLPSLPGLSKEFSQGAYQPLRIYPQQNESIGKLPYNTQTSVVPAGSGTGENSSGGDEKHHSIIASARRSNSLHSFIPSYEPLIVRAPSPSINRGMSNVEALPAATVVQKRTSGQYFPPTVPSQQLSENASSNSSNSYASKPPSNSGETVLTRYQSYTPNASFYSASPSTLPPRELKMNAVNSVKTLFKESTDQISSARPAEYYSNSSRTGLMSTNEGGNTVSVPNVVETTSTTTMTTINSLKSSKLEQYPTIAPTTTTTIYNNNYNNNNNNNQQQIVPSSVYNSKYASVTTPEQSSISNTLNKQMSENQISYYEKIQQYPRESINNQTNHPTLNTQAQMMHQLPLVSVNENKPPKAAQSSRVNSQNEEDIHKRTSQKSHTQVVPSPSQNSQYPRFRHSNSYGESSAFEQQKQHIPEFQSSTATATNNTSYSSIYQTTYPKQPLVNDVVAEQQTQYPASIGLVKKQESSNNGVSHYNSSPNFNSRYYSSKQPVYTPSSFTSQGHESGSTIQELKPSSNGVLSADVVPATITVANESSQQHFKSEMTQLPAAVPSLVSAISSEPMTTSNSNKAGGSQGKEMSENEKYVAYMKQIKLKEAEKAFVMKIDNFFGFMRKRALFANAALLNFWNSTRQVKLDSDLQCVMLYCLCSYYYFALEYLRKILFKEVEQKVIKKDGFEVYQRSVEYTQTKEIISRDVSEAKQLFQDIQPYMISEIQASSKSEIKSFMRFVGQKSTRHDDYRQRLTSLIPKAFEGMNLAAIDRTAAKGVHMVQIFNNIEELIPSKQYNDFDFNKFYDDRFNNLSLEQLQHAISSMASKEPKS